MEMFISLLWLYLPPSSYAIYAWVSSGTDTTLCISPSSWDPCGRPLSSPLSPSSGRCWPSRATRAGPRAGHKGRRWVSSVHRPPLGGSHCQLPSTPPVCLPESLLSPSRTLCDGRLAVLCEPGKKEVEAKPTEAGPQGELVAAGTWPALLSCHGLLVLIPAQDPARPPPSPPSWQGPLLFISSVFLLRKLHRHLLVSSLSLDILTLPTHTHSLSHTLSPSHVPLHSHTHTHSYPLVSHSLTYTASHTHSHSDTHWCIYSHVLIPWHSPLFSHTLTHTFSLLIHSHSPSFSLTLPHTHFYPLFLSLPTLSHFSQIYSPFWRREEKPILSTAGMYSYVSALCLFYQRKINPYVFMQFNR